MIERSHLTIIREVERQGSLTAAAHVLCLTQSALSHTIKKLEHNFGSKIWFREGKKLRLTQSGIYLLKVANRVLPQLEKAHVQLKEYAAGKRGLLQIGVECHPCYEWLLRVISPFLMEWPTVDVDVNQRFQFGGIGALLGQELDVLITPDPLYKSGLHFEVVYEYEQVLVVGKEHHLARKKVVQPADIKSETLITYPVGPERLDIFTHFLNPAGMSPERHKTIESTDITLQMIECGRGVTALPLWLVRRYEEKMSIVPVRLGSQGIFKNIFLGVRQSDLDVEYIKSFIKLSRSIAS